MLDIGISAYTNPRTRSNAEVGGCTGYAELKAASSYDMFLNLSTTRTDGGWMYLKIGNDDYLQLSSSDNKVNIYKDTTISGNSDVGTTCNNSIKMHGAGVTTLYAVFATNNVFISYWGGFKLYVILPP